MEGILAILLIFGGGTLVFLSFSPVGRALADRIRHGAIPPESQNAALREELEFLRQELADVQERLDFTERLLTRRPDVAELPKGDGGG